MKSLLVILSLSITVSAISHDDLRTVTFGFLTGLSVNQDPYEIIECLDDNIISYWDEFIKVLKDIEDLYKIDFILEAFTYLLKPSFYTIYYLYPCSNGELQDILNDIEKQSKDPNQFTEKVIRSYDIILVNLSELKKEWNKGDLMLAGQYAGALIKIILS